MLMTSLQSLMMKMILIKKRHVAKMGHRAIGQLIKTRKSVAEKKMGEMLMLPSFLQHNHLALSLEHCTRMCCHYSLASSKLLMMTS